MATIRQDEIIEKALPGDPSAVPRYNLRAPDGTLIGENIALELANMVTQMGTPVNAATLNEMLAASGVTAGTASAYTITQENFVLFDGAPVRFRLHVASGTNPTLNVNGTGAKALKTALGDAMPSAIPVGVWVDAFYSAALDVYILAGVNVSKAQIASWNKKPTTEEVITEIIARSAKVITGTYTGNGNSGSSAKRSLSFDFTPKLVIIIQSTANATTYTRFPAIMVNPSTRGYGMDNNGDGYGFTVAWGSQQVSWYASTAQNQMNYDGYKYTYVAVGL